jgi:AhpD family alkylhydroperoxidase
MRSEVRNRERAANLERLLAKSPATLEGFLALRGALQSGTLAPRLRAAIALVVSEANGCGYCLSRNVARARIVGLDEETIAEAREARSADERVRAALAFAEGLVFAHGGVSDAEVARLKEAGYTEGEVVEIIGIVTLTLSENYFALAARLPDDSGERVLPHCYSEVRR